MIFCWSHIQQNFFFSVACEIFLNEFFIIHLEIIVDELQSLLIVFCHHIGIFSDNMNLLNPLLIKFIKLCIIFFFIADSVIQFDSLNLDTTVKYQKSAFQLH